MFRIFVAIAKHLSDKLLSFIKFTIGEITQFQSPWACSGFSGVYTSPTLNNLGSLSDDGKRAFNEISKPTWNKSNNYNSSIYKQDFD